MKQRKIKVRLYEGDFTVGWDELFYDLIFVIVIGKISALTVASPEINLGFIISEFILFIVMSILWATRVNHAMRISLLSDYFEVEKPDVQLYTYIEICLLIISFYLLNTISYQFILLIMGVVLVTMTLSIASVRNQIINKLSREVTRPGKDYVPPVQVEYLIERYVVLVILFLGEMIAVSFEIAKDVVTLTSLLIIIVIMFTTITSIFRAAESEMGEDQERNGQLFVHLRTYFYMLLVTMLGLVICGDLSEHYNLITKFGFIILLVVWLWSNSIASHHLEQKSNNLLVGFIGWYAAITIIPVSQLIRFGLILVGLLVMYLLHHHSKKKNIQ